MSASDDEAALIEQAVAGDEGALERLLVRHHAQLAGDLSRKVPASHQAIISVDDVLQDTYTAAFGSIHSFRSHGASSFYRWLVTIAEHRLFDALRAESTAKRGGGHVRVTLPESSSSAAEWLEVLAEDERTPSQSAARREEAELVRSAMAALNSDYREALRLRYMEGLPVTETAARMNRSEGAVCLLCHRGLKQLHQALGSSTLYFPSAE